ncbi:hypothetical protein KDA_43070 [Dictyobacter alpinus]|uniref:YtkA-like domain-containing protein n=1 Tax=Dictyobacter alpinus TaxID=2014873 RepID=A0A402BBQ4_9CHLR|nr:hypothetical protein [Dictyobacter alpinus]GCE28823.1 hypothetical protein KDA_43070 [Dictyobacter alpinus]
MSKPLQFVLLGIGVLALLVVLGELAYSVAATTHGSTPARVVKVNAGKYPLTVNLYTYPAKASYALPFSIEPQQPINGKLSYDVTSTPDPSDASATPVRAGLSPDANHPNAIQGTAEITVQGLWTLDISVNGPDGPGEARIPITATAPPALPQWLGWAIGLIPIYGLTIFLIAQRRRPKTQQPTVAA